MSSGVWAGVGMGLGFGNASWKEITAATQREKRPIRLRREGCKQKNHHGFCLDL